MIWAFVDVLGRRLVLWAVLSVLPGLLLLAAGDGFWQGVGLMFVAWGAIDGLLGMGARSLAARHRTRYIDDPGAAVRESRRIRRLLWANALLDVGYVAVGATLAAGLAGAEPFTRGLGWGVIVQGVFLLGFDVLHARWTPDGRPILPVEVPLFAGPVHKAFALAPGAAWTAPAGGALLLHGFGGTPAQLRHLGERLAGAGWVVETPLLPGFGAAIRELPDRRLEDWLAAVDDALERLRLRGHGPLLLVGHSMGAALVLVAATRTRADALVLLAPFWWPSAWWHRPLGPLMRTLLPPAVRPFRSMDPSAPEVRRGLEAFLPGLDLDDAAVRGAVTELQVPVSVFEQLYRVSRQALAAAPAASGDVLVIQGTADDVSLPARTRLLVERLPAGARLQEVDAGHDLLTDASPVRDRVTDEILALAAGIAAPAAARPAAAAT
jgi:carboxylesterase